MVKGSGFRVWGLGFRVEGLGFITTTPREQEVLQLQMCQGPMYLTVRYFGMLVSSNCFLDSGKYVVIGYLESWSSVKHEGFQVPLLEVPLSAPF